MPLKGRRSSSLRVPKAYAVSCEIRSGEASAPVTFHAVVKSLKEFTTTRKWHIERLPGDEKLEFKLVPASSREEVSICQLKVESVPDSRAVRVTFKGPKDMNPKGHLDQPRLLSSTRRARLAHAEGNRAFA